MSFMANLCSIAYLIDSTIGLARRLEPHVVIDAPPCQRAQQQTFESGTDLPKNILFHKLVTTKTGEKL